MLAVCGECLIDLIPHPSSPLSKTKSTARTRIPRSRKIDLPLYKGCIGGSPLNTAVAISRLKNPVTMVSRISRDSFGTAIKKHLALNGVGLQTVVTGEESTTLGFVIPRNGGGEDFVFYAHHCADRLFRIRELPPLPSRVRHIHFSSIALQMEPCGHTYEHLMQREYRHRTVSLDPNVRPLFIKDRDGFRRRIERMIKMVGVFRASDQDLEYLYPKSSPETAVKKILPHLRPPGVVALTQGKKGAKVFYLSRGSKIERLHSSIKKNTKVVDTVGAGDTFTGAFLHILYHHKLIGHTQKSKTTPIPSPDILKEALDFAIKASAINCGREGCDPAFLNEIKH